MEAIGVSIPVLVFSAAVTILTSLLSALAAGITGELIHVDGGYHAMGTDLSF